MVRKVDATEGTIGNFHIASDSIRSGDADITDDSNQFLFIKSNDDQSIIAMANGGAAIMTRTSGDGGFNAGGIFLKGDGTFRLGKSNGQRIENDGNNLIMSSSKFFLGGGSQFVSGSNGNLEISSSNFHLTKEGNITASNANLSGKITATSGELGDFDISSDGIIKQTGTTSQVTSSITPGLILLKSLNTTSKEQDQIKLINAGGKQQLDVVSNPNFNSSDNSTVSLFGSSNISQSAVTVRSTYNSETMGITLAAGSLQSDGVVAESGIDTIARIFTQNSVFPNYSRLDGVFKLQERLDGSVSNSQVPSGSGVLIEVKERQQIFFSGNEKDGYIYSQTQTGGSPQTQEGFLDIFASGSNGSFHLGDGLSGTRRGVLRTTGSKHEDILFSGQMDVNTETIDITTQATDIDLIDNNASALSFDSSGRSGIMEVITTNNAEKVKFSGLGGIQVETNITANGNIVGDGSTSLTSMNNGTFAGTVQAEHLYTTDDLQVGDDITAGGDLDVGGTYTNDTQPAFLARNTSVDSNKAKDTFHTVEFNSEVYDQANNFNNSTDTFTAPVTGKYLLSAQVRLDDIQNDADFYELNIVTSNRTYRRFIDPVGFDTQVDHFGMSLTVVADMDTSDTAFVRVRQSGGTTSTLDIEAHASDLDTFFSGYLLG